MFTGVATSTVAEETSTEAETTSTAASSAEATNAEETSTEEAKATSESAASPTDDSQDEQKNDEDNGLSTGVKIGLGVGVSLGAILLIALAVISWKYHKARQEKQSMSQPVQQIHQDPGMMYGTKFVPASGKPMDYSHFGYVREMPGTTVSWQNQQTVHELSASPSMRGPGRPY